MDYTSMVIITILYSFFSVVIGLILIGLGMALRQKNKLEKQQKRQILKQKDKNIWFPK